MKKFLLFIGLIIVSLITLTSCAFTDEIHVVFISETGAIVGEYDVSMVKQINVPELNYPRAGLNFRGWVLDQNATSPKVKSGYTLRYSTIRSWTDENYVVMYALWLEKSDICIAWDGTEASGLDEDKINAIKANLKTAMSAEFGFEVTINMRKYEYTDSNSILDATNKITSHGDVDIVFGFANTVNKPSYGNLTMTKYNSEYPISGKIRTIGTLNNKELTKFAYEWLNDQSNMTMINKARNSEHDLVIGWGWNGVAEIPPTSTSVANTTCIDYKKANNLLTNLKAYLASKGYSDLDIVFTPLRNTPLKEGNANVAAINDGNYDIVINFGSTLTNFIEVTKKKTVVINDCNRVNYQLNSGSTIVDLAWSYINSSDGINSLSNTTLNNVKIGIDMRATSGITSENVINFTTALQNYVTNNSLPFTVEVVQYEISDTKELGDQIKADNVDIVIGMGSNYNTVGGVTFYGYTTCTINGIEGRRILAITTNSETVQIYNWILNNAMETLNAIKG